MWLLYAALAVSLLGCALLAHQAHNTPGTAFFAAAAVGFALATVHTSWLLDEHRFVLAQLNARQRAAQTRATAEDDAVRIAVAAASCCETSWTSAGAEHDPEHCTRKDQTT
jgi:hypothetical protein